MEEDILREEPDFSSFKTNEAIPDNGPCGDCDMSIFSEDPPRSLVINVCGDVIHRTCVNKVDNQSESSFCASSNNHAICPSTFYTLAYKSSSLYTTPYAYGLIKLHSILSNALIKIFVCQQFLRIEASLLRNRLGRACDIFFWLEFRSSNLPSYRFTPATKKKKE
ncbi:uncharacterized protein OCT59_019008 [Rhizophagus irregularis]|uniref:uncharacterized protein n=1 Tax=Rhizophagus irregularis TaxID=588596 RepID=UPI003322EB78|nr:hypothetical protein OCT59_019008 [Rhizophagus irregularis]